MVELGLCGTGEIALWAVPELAKAVGEPDEVGEQMMMAMLGMSRWDSGAGIMQSRNQILGAPNRDLEINLTPSQTSTDTVNLTPSQTNTQSN